MKQESRDRIIGRNIAGEANAKEQAQLSDMLSADEKDRVFYNVLNNRKDYDETLPDKESVFKKVLDKVELTEQNNINSKRFSLSRVSAAIAAVLFISLLIQQYIDPFSLLNTLDSNVVITRAGEVKRIKLPDGTNIWINSKSKLKYPKQFVAETRNIYLEGEAFFDVAKMSDTPFIVDLKDSEVKVIGTSFNIKAYNIDNAVSTSVVSGLVSFAKKKHKPVFLKPGNKGVLSGNKIVKTNYNCENDKAWVDGKLIFDSTPMAEIIETVERKFGIDIKIVNTGILNEKFSAEFSGENVSEIIKTLSLTGKFTYSKEDGKHIIK